MYVACFPWPVGHSLLSLSSIFKWLNCLTETFGVACIILCFCIPLESTSLSFGTMLANSSSPGQLVTTVVASSGISLLVVKQLLVLIRNFKFLTVRAVKRVEMLQLAKFCQNRLNRGRDMATFSRQFQIFNGRGGQEGRTASSCQISSKSAQMRLRYGYF